MRILDLASQRVLAMVADGFDFDAAAGLERAIVDLRLANLLLAEAHARLFLRTKAEATA